jgi:ABC-type glycerol-3-phosphate transport system substrate-binding protein
MNLRPFELILVVVFGGLFFVALILLKTYEAEPDPNVALIGELSIWGTLPEEHITNLLNQIKTEDEAYERVTYKYISPDNFDSEFVTALADQQAPDLLLIPHESLVEHRGRLQALSYEAFPLRTIRDTYVEGAEIFALSDGVYGLPLMVDPLVQYWNRDIFSSNGILGAPKTWEDMVANVVPTLTIKDFNRNVNRASVALGEYSNVKNAFGILSLLLVQGGSSLVKETSPTLYSVELNYQVGGGNNGPFDSAVAFYSNFSNINNSLYTWNRSLREDKDMFLSEDLALYFGLASEGKDIEVKNPNLSFDVAEVPQGATATNRRTYGVFYAFSIPKAAKNKNASLVVMQKLADVTNAKTLADRYGMAPVHRASLAAGSSDVYGRVAYTSAVVARAWLNPDRDRLDNVLSTMLDDVNANRRDVYGATSDAVTRIQQTF